MQRSRNNLLQIGAVFTASLVGCLISYSQVKGEQITLFTQRHFWFAANSTNIANLADGNYQFCSQTDPQDWRDGAGVCLNFTKTGNYVDGYYGYPHSSHFICLRGTVERNKIAGEALEILWDNNQQHQIPKSAFPWDSEGRLILNQGNIMPTFNQGEDATEMILYRSAVLNIEGFHQYNSPRMTPPSQLCEWKLT